MRNASSIFECWRCRYPESFALFAAVRIVMFECVSLCRQRDDSILRVFVIVVFPVVQQDLCFCFS
jgi:hypothetical protein